MSDARPDGDVDATVLRSTEEFYGPAGVPESPTPLRRPGQEPADAVSRRTRKATLRLSHVDPWSVMKTSFVFSIAFGIAALILVLITWLVLSVSGVFNLINEQIGALLMSPGDTQQFRIQDFFGLSKTMGLTILLSVLNVVILTAMSTLMAFLYNTACRLIGGLEVTLAED
ncbi:DUF3566 domain-containing protein [Raineyella sp. LH-20]|uniref:DUF3566 domain-containing protein n=1 Tax=Raineyella sp. LH-20 TaxID=3081204 RepID=UPI002954D00F|nr:DUF3566 domain-containing protein [Raineyella sp. LH-20]WOP19602.1 DUF3566 domain-containing protein [Raineyella sp. LH-20]